MNFIRGFVTDLTQIPSWYKRITVAWEVGCMNAEVRKPQVKSNILISARKYEFRNDEWLS